MANLGKTRTYAANNFIQRGSLLSVTERKGIIARMARWLYKLTKWQRLEYYGYGVIAASSEDYKAPIGIAIDSNTILIGGTLEYSPNHDKNKDS